ncbi:unnamed protein product, partial [marine sediment metagenome]
NESMLAGYKELANLVRIELARTSKDQWFIPTLEGLNP